MPPFEKESIPMRVSLIPLEFLPQFFLWLIFLAPAMRIEQSLYAPNFKGIIFDI